MTQVALMGEGIWGTLGRKNTETRCEHFLPFGKIPEQGWLGFWVPISTILAGEDLGMTGEDISQEEKQPRDPG